jgi:hypothetical protein
LNWDALAAKESGGNWANTSNPKYSGGLQFDQATWERYGGTGSPASASKEQQIAIAQRAYNDQGGGQNLWPTNYGQLNAPQVFDTGDGWLQPGATVVHNNTGAPEHLTTPNQHMPWGSTPGQPAAPGPDAGAQAGKQGPSQIGGAEPKNAPGGSQSGGGLVGAATGAAAMAADMFAPGSGAAVQIASQEAQRAIKFAGQATAIGLGGLMETFLPFGGSDLANNNWLTRGASAFAGVQPQIPNLAGKSASVDAMQKNPKTAQPMPLPQPISSGQGDGSARGPTVVNNTFHVSNTGAANDTNEHVLAGLVGKQYDPVGAR